MKKTIGFLMVAVFLMGSEAFASVNTLKQMVQRAQMYYKNGHDNNYIASKISFADDVVSTIGTKFMAISSADELKKVIKLCVFMRHGAYGDHFSAKNQEFYADAYTKDLIKARKGHKFYRVEGSHLVENGIFSAPCGLAIFDNQNNAAVMQSLSID